MELSEILPVLSLVTSVAVSFLVARFYGERWVEIARRRREHSMKLNDGVLKPWKSKVEEYCKVDAMFSRDVNKMIGVEPKDPTNLEFFDVAKKHLESKYPSILKAWEELKIVTTEYNREFAAVLEEIRMLVIKELNMPCYYWRPAAEQPEEYIMPDRLAQSIYQEIEWREPEKRKWASGEPLISPTMYRNEKIFHLEWAGTLVKARDKKVVENAILLINRIIETSTYKEKANNLMKRKKETYDTRREAFETKIEEIIAAIELGNNLHGKCRFCP